MTQPGASPAFQRPAIALPAVAALYLDANQAFYLSDDGELRTLSHDEARLLIHKKPVLLCHAPYIRGRLGMEHFYPFDVLELFAFVHPARFCVPTPIGLCKALGIDIPSSAEDIPPALFDIARALLGDIQNDAYCAKADPLKLAGVMGLNGKGWAWTPYIFTALGQIYDPKEPLTSKSELNVWRHLPEWAEEAPVPPPSHHGVTKAEVELRLAQLLRDDHSEKRESQTSYAISIAQAFEPVEEEGKPHIVLAEAGTGIGKTLGYIAPASVWAEKNDGSVWISTYTKNLQRQIDQELNRLYPEQSLKDIHVGTRKGRENYLCLLNFEESAAAAGLAYNPAQAVAAGIMARWVAASKDGDLTGGGFPGWLTGLLGYNHTRGLADRRGECVYAACDHYRKCFVEHGVRKSKRARIVVANHAVVMTQAALSSSLDDMPRHYIFDEGHHLFTAADSAFAGHLTGAQMYDLRRWIRGSEGGRRTRARGLARRCEDLAEGDDKARGLVQDILHRAEALCSDGWQKRLKDDAAKGAGEQFITLVLKQVMARADGKDEGYSLETALHPAIELLPERAQTLQKALKYLQKPMNDLAEHFRKRLQAQAETLSTETRKRLDTIITSIERRSRMTLQAWIDMLGALRDGAASSEFVDWLELTRIDGQTVDAGYYRHWIDPMKPFAASLRPHVKGMAVTSATLKDGAAEHWDQALRHTGAAYLNFEKTHHESFPSPFDYPAATRVFVIDDVNKTDARQVSSAYQTLFKASQGGGLGLFTSIQRLRRIHGMIAPGLVQAGINLYAQHVDQVDTGTLVDMFREDTHACLLGTDAMRDGVDVPGESLRLIVFDRVPWPRPTILHKARRKDFGGKTYDESLTRLKIKQAFGRLIRRKTDRGVFVMLDSAFPSRLHDAFPPGVTVHKIGLAEAAAHIRSFLA